MANLWVTVTAVEVNGGKVGEVRIRYRTADAVRVFDADVFLPVQTNAKTANAAIRDSARTLMESQGATYQPSDNMILAGGFVDLPLTGPF